MLNTLVASYGKQIGSCVIKSPECRVFPCMLSSLYAEPIIVDQEGLRE